MSPELMSIFTFCKVILFILNILLGFRTVNFYDEEVSHGAHNFVRLIGVFVTIVAVLGIIEIYYL